MTYIYPLKTKSEALSSFKQYKSLVEKNFDTKIKTIHTDWGEEFRVFTSFLNESGIEFRHPCPHMSEQNGIVERKHRHIVEMGLTLLAHSSMPLRFWWDVFATTVFIINHLPTPVLNYISLWEKAFCSIPDFAFLRTFGCACYPCLRPYQTHKPQFHSTKCVFLGYSVTHKGYKCLSSNDHLYISRHVVFNENESPFKGGFLTHLHRNVSSDSVVNWCPFPKQSAPLSTPSLASSVCPQGSASYSVPLVRHSSEFHAPSSPVSAPSPDIPEGPLATAAPSLPPVPNNATDLLQPL